VLLMQRFLGSTVKMTSSLIWLSIKARLRKTYAWCKKYWQILVGAAIPIILMIIFKKNNEAGKILDRARDDYKKEIDVINKSHNKEIEDIEVARKIYLKSLKEIEEKYIDAKESLDDKKKKEIEKVILENVNNPDEITRRISEITGFEIHVS